MNIAYPRFNLRDVFTKLGHFLLLKRKFSYFHLIIPPKNIYFVENSRKSQETSESSTMSCHTNRADKLILYKTNKPHCP